MEQWTTDGTAHVLTAKLTAGATYVLHEVSAPAGYCKAADQSFVVPADGSKKILTMTDLATRVNVESWMLTASRCPEQNYSCWTRTAI